MTDQSQRDLLLRGGDVTAASAVLDTATSQAVSPTKPDISSSEWAYCTTKELVAALKTRKVSASELADHTIARIESLDQHLNAVVVRDFARARQAAAAADLALARGESQPLLGVPITIKEAFNIAGLPTTWGFLKFRHFVPKKDALVVSRLKGAGAVVLGKTNVPLGLGDFQSYNDVYGTTNNPWDIGRSPGGSSGRVRRGPRFRLWTAVLRIRHRWIAARAGTFLRCLRAQADAGPGAFSRIRHAVISTFAAGDRSCRDRPDG